MYTIEDLEFAITRLRILREYVRDKEYNHKRFFDCNGGPSCLLGYSTELFNGMYKFDEIPFSEKYKGIHCGIDIFRFSKSICEYLFGFEYVSIEFYSNLNMSIHINSRGEHRSIEDKEKETSIKRLDKIEEYLRRKLASLLAEEECRTIHHRKISEKILV